MPSAATLPQYLKFLDSNGKGPYSGYDWPIGEWVDTEGELELCRNGIHVTTIDNAIDWLSSRCHPVEIRGETLDGSDKLCVRSARLLPALDTWNDRTARLFAADCAEHVLHIFEKARPDDTRPRDAIEAARAFANEDITAAARAAAWDAWDAAGAAWDAAGAARAAAWAAGAAARDAARDAAGDARAAAGGAEHEWQGERLAEYLTGNRGAQ